MRARLPYLIVAAVCAVLVALLDPPGGANGRATAGVPSFGGVDTGDDPAEARIPAAHVAVLSSIGTSGWVPPVSTPLPPAQRTSPDGPRLFLAGLMLVSLAAAARRG